ncbi:MAG TPA: non-canonical purine NTP pyrophosphatase [Bryobacteraceae bacterium]|nr:non-canonical purine NTP pyrophosphatase [Bryobacteraceae bacterium]
MATKSRIRIVYVTSSKFKKEENETFLRECSLANGTRVDDVFEFDIRPVPIQEILNVDLSVMVSAEVVSAYSQLKVPCIVEHAGLIFSEYADRSYPGGLTKPMWDTLKDGFVKETGSAGRNAVARAVIAYCDGKQVKTFVGERTGTIAERPRGGREFYWDTIFIPEDDSGRSQGRTYAEIVESADLGLAYKIRELSQSSAAMKSFLEYRLKTGDPELWR